MENVHALRKNDKIHQGKLKEPTKSYVPSQKQN